MLSRWLLSIEEQDENSKVDDGNYAHQIDYFKTPEATVWELEVSLRNPKGNTNQVVLLLLFFLRFLLGN